MSNKRSNSFRQAILQGNRRLSSKALLEEKGLSLSQRLIRHVAYETLPREIDRKWYYDSYTCCPPPWFMITVTLLEARTRVERGRGGLSKPGVAWGEEVGGSRGESCRSNSSASQSLTREPRGCKETPKFWGVVCLFLVVCIYMCVCMLTCMYMCVPNEARSECQIPWMWNYRPLPCVGAGSPTPVLWENSKRP